jgi:ATP-dependent Clp protease ATP-binding subunit ClpC
LDVRHDHPLLPRGPTGAGFEPQFGARPLRRAIQREVDNPLARLLLDGRLERGRRVTVGVRDGRLDFAVDQPAEPTTAGV